MSEGPNDQKSTTAWGSRGKRGGYISNSLLNEDQIFLSQYIIEIRKLGDRRFSGASIRQPSSIVFLNSLTLIPLDTKLTENAYKMRFKNCTAIQRVSIPILMSESNLIACDRIYYGRKETYILCILQKMIALGPTNSCNKPTAMIICSDNRSAESTYRVTRLLSSKMGIKVLSTHQPSFSIDSIAKMDLDIIIITHNHINRVINQSLSSISEIKYIVIDEINEMVSDEPSLNSIYIILKHTALNSNSSFYIFGSLLPVYLSNMLDKYSLKSQHISMGSVSNLFQNITQHFISVPEIQRYTLLYETLCRLTNKVLIFVDKSNLEYLNTFLKLAGFRAKVLAQSFNVHERKSVSKLMSNSTPEILAIRDLDMIFFKFSNIDTVINLDMPPNIDFYIHRVTSVLSSGTVISFLSEKDAKTHSGIKEMLRECGRNVPVWM